MLFRNVGKHVSNVTFRGYLKDASIARLYRDERCIEDNLEGSSHDLIEALPWNLPGMYE
jgi:hypothetical protein